MPWEKSFNEDEAIAKAMKVFWRKGFEHASLADLISATGITRGSLYNAFGGKEQLFIKSLMKYDQEHRRTFLSELEAMDNPTLAIQVFFERIVDETLCDTEKKGCFIVNTASELAIHGNQVNSIVHNGIREIEAFFRRSIEVAQVRGNISKGVNPIDTAKALLAMLVAIRILGRGVFDKIALTTISAQALRLIE